MKPVMYACLAMVLYSLQNVILEQKLAKYTNASLLFYFYIVMLPLTLALILSLRVTKQPIIWPSGTAILIAIGVGAIYFFADYCFIGAYTNGGSLIMVMTIAMLFPVFASVIKYFWVGRLPNFYQIISYFFAAVSIILLIKGNLKGGI